MTVNISKISQNGSGVDVEWNDGEKSNFNFMRLRDNCPTARDKDSRHRMFNLLEVSTNISPKQFKINAEGKLEIEWNEGNHTSYYDPKWLRKNCYTINNKKKQTFNEKLCAVRKVFDNYNLVSALHTFMSFKNEKYKRILPPLSLLSDIQQKELMSKLKKLEFFPEKNIAV